MDNKSYPGNNGYPQFSGNNNRGQQYNNRGSNQPQRMNRPPMGPGNSKQQRMNPNSMSDNTNNRMMGQRNQQSGAMRNSKTQPMPMYNDINRAQTGRIPTDVINNLAQTGRIPTDMVASMADANRGGASGMKGSVPTNKRDTATVPPIPPHMRNGVPPRQPVPRPTVPPKNVRPSQQARPIAVQPVRQNGPMGGDMGNGAGKQKSSTPLVVAIVAIMIIATIGYVTQSIWLGKIKGMNGAMSNSSANVATPAPTAEAGPFYVNIYYQPTLPDKFDKIYIHYQKGSGAWTALPGEEMELCKEDNGFKFKYTIPLDYKGDLVTCCFTDGNDKYWDSNLGGHNYVLPEGDYGMYFQSVYPLNSNGEIKPPTDSVSIYYASESESAYVHYTRAKDGEKEEWTPEPGELMKDSELTVKSILGTTYNFKYDIEMNGQNEIIACFNDGKGKWDSNGSNNYRLIPGMYLFMKENGFTRFRDISKLEEDKAAFDNKN